MRRYRVEFLPSARRDLRDSFEWGVEAWGKEQAEKWLSEFYFTCRKQLGSLPKACPKAPESEDLDRELRHLIIGRYRVVFLISDDLVTVLYVRGPYLRP